MDDRKFDRITQALATDGSRRRVLGIVAGGVAALAGAATLEAKRGGNGKGRGRGRGRGNGGDGGNGNGNGNGGNGDGGNGRGRGRQKVSLCHRNDEGGFNFITVGAPAVPAHERHGDVICETDRACAVATGCDEDGACVFGPADEGTACEVDGEAGTCDADGTCVVEDPGAEG